MPPLFVIVGAWLAGVVAASRLAWDPVPLLLGAAASLFAPLLWLRRRLAWWVPVAAVVVVGAFWRVGQADVRPSSELAALNGQGPVSLRGRVIREPEIRDRRMAILVGVEALRWADASWHHLPGLALVQTGRYPEVAYGDLVRVSGRPETPPAWEGFDYRGHLARQGVGTIIPFASVQVEARGEGDQAIHVLLDVRRRLAQALAATLPEPQAALAQGILLGVRSSLPPAVAEAFNASGLAHLLAVSGSNVGLVAAAAMGLTLSHLGRRKAVLAALAAVGAYALLVGLVPSVTRASFMLGLSLLALLSGRQAYGVLSLGLAASLLLAWDPRYLWDVGFQLSFAATAGILFLAPRGIFGAGPPALAGATSSLLRMGGDVALVTCGAVLATAPITAATFHRFSLVALPANLVAGPLFAVALGGSAVTAIAGLVWQPLGMVVGWVTWLPLNVLSAVGQFFGDLPFAALPTGTVPEALVWLYYGALTAVAWSLTRGGQFGGWPLAKWLGGRLPARLPHPRFSSVTAGRGLAVLVCGNAVVWLTLLLTADGRTRVYVLDVGQGDALLVKTAAGRAALIDGGPSPSRLGSALGPRLPLWDRDLDLVVLSHPQEDHLAGLVEAVGRHRVGVALDSQLPSPLPLYSVFQRRLADREVRVQKGQAGSVVQLGTRTHLEVIHPPAGGSGSATDPNRASVVSRLVVGDVSFLLTGDAPADVLETLSGESLRAAVLKVPHHGARGGLSPSLLTRVSPAVAVISVGEGNAYGHPAGETLAMLDGTALLRTDQHGTVEFATDGRRLWLRTERRPRS